VVCLPKIPFSGFHQCNATISIRQGRSRSEHEYGAVKCGPDCGLRFLGRNPVTT
jgi:hypothetical protein